MYRTKSQPPAGRQVIAHFSNLLGASKFNRANERICDEKSESIARKHVPGREPERTRSSTILAYVLIGASCAGILGCGGLVFKGGSSGSTPDGSSTLVVTPSPIDFGTVTVGSSAVEKVSVANAGSEAVQITSLTFSNAAFTVSGQGTLPVSLPAGSSLGFSVHFTPRDTTDLTGQLNVNAMSNDMTSLLSAVKLHGKGARSASLFTLSCASATMTGAGSDKCTVTLSSAAASTGMVVSLASSSTAITVPSSVTVSSGATAASFVASVSAVKSSQTVTLTAKQGSVSKSISIKLNSASTTTVAAPSVSALSCGSKSFTGAGTTRCTVSLSSAALTGGMGIALASSKNAVSVPGSVTVAAGAITATFTANVAAVSTSQIATITASADSSSRSFDLQLNAAISSLSLSTTSLSFGNVAIGTAVTKSVTLTSNGTSAVTINSDSITGAGFSVSGASFPLTLNPGQAAVLTVEYAPATASSVTGLLTISSTAPTLTVSLSGTGTTGTPTVSGFSCDSIWITGSLLDACTVSLSGSAPSGGVSVMLASSSPVVKVPGSVLVPATATSAAFVATVALVSSTQSVTLTATAGGKSKSITLQLNASAAGLSVDATSISFGSTTLNTPITQSLTLSAMGSAIVTINSVTVTGSGFSVAGATFPVRLNPGQSLNLTLQFDPTTRGAATGLLTIISDSPSNPTTVITLTGTGSTLRVDLTWNAPSDSTDPIAGYNVYRAASGTAAYERLNSALDSATTYSDAAVQSGQSYDYVVKTVDTAGNESGPSNVTTVGIP